jgi:hypothetical protein
MYRLYQRKGLLFIYDVQSGGSWTCSQGTLIVTLSGSLM